MPVLSEILSSIKARGSVYFCDKLEPPWEMKEKVKYSSAFHYVRRGQCWVSFFGEDYLLGPGDLVFIGKGDDHVLSSSKLSEIAETFDGPTHLLCGYFSFRDPIPSPLDEAMPSILVLRSDEIAELSWLKTTLEHLSSEYDSQTPGAMVVVNKLTEVVLVELIRFHINKLDSHNFVAALFDKQIGKALKFIHQQPEQSWTLELLASEVAMSRASFARRFKDMVGQPMFQYLTLVRMRIASDLLRSSQKSVADIAQAVGYVSEMAFTKVFKEHNGATPIAWRRQYITSLKDSDK
ncbi:MAG: AraC-like DNA-binding protein [Oleiphilaceae bacterium]|jgi:AraC-like DNA-binding protein